MATLSGELASIRKSIEDHSPVLPMKKRRKGRKKLSDVVDDADDADDEGEGSDSKVSSADGKPPAQDVFGVRYSLSLDSLILIYVHAFRRLYEDTSRLS